MYFPLVLVLTEVRLEIDNGIIQMVDYEISLEDLWKTAWASLSRDPFDFSSNYLLDTFMRIYPMTVNGIWHSGENSYSTPRNGTASAS